ncbi:MAG: hypothetical protein QNL04_13455, partial [SAR324 cluster bacterium]|nr:hypothetical protein [SAR324 cluster bacterium]
VTTAGAWMHLNVEGGVSEGDLVKYQVTTIYAVSVDSSGKLTVTSSTPDFKDLSNFDTSTWSQIYSLGSIDDMISSIQGYWGMMRTFLEGETNSILAMLNGSCTWVFPGGETFVFKNAQFSNFQDFVSNVTYAEPTAQRLQAKRVTFDAASKKVSLV